ncbi:MAG: hypothetical protein ABIL11_18790 [Chloroflexota bacterium]
MLLDFDLLEWLVGIGILVVLLTILWRRKRSLYNLFFFSVFWVYLLFVVKEVVFPFYVPENYVDMTFRPSVNIIPLYFGRCEMPSLCVTQIVQNILLTVPFGFGVSFIIRFKARGFLWLAISAVKRRLLSGPYRDRGDSKYDVQTF